MVCPAHTSPIHHTPQLKLSCASDRLIAERQKTTKNSMRTIALVDIMIIQDSVTIVCYELPLFQREREGAVGPTTSIIPSERRGSD